MNDVLVGLVLALIGAGFCFRGFLAMRIIIPIWGAMAGFLVGAGLVARITDESFLGSLLGWLVGAGVAFLFGLLAYLYYEISIFVAMGAIGFSLGTSLMVALGIEWSWLVVLVGVVAGVGLAYVAVIGDLPMAILVVLTAFAGSAAIVAGLMLVFGTVDLDEFAASTTERIDDGWWWYAIYFVAGFTGIFTQIRYMERFRGGLREAWADAGGRELRRES
ncbi:MAG: DUF4203 domain-containing protein [Actinomycetota bacterium]